MTVALLAADSAANPVLGFVLLALGGILAGGAWATREHSTKAAVVLGVLAVLAVVGGVLWQIDA